MQLLVGKQATTSLIVHAHTRLRELEQDDPRGGAARFLRLFENLAMDGLTLLDVRRNVRIALGAFVLDHSDLFLQGEARSEAEQLDRQVTRAFRTM